MRDLIFLSLENWDEIWRRNQFLCATFARRHPEMKILFVGVPRHTVEHLRAGRLKPLLTDPAYVVPGYPNITVTRPLRVAPDSLEWGLRVNERLYRRHVIAAARKLGLSDPVLWINPHNAYHLAGRMRHAAVIYDITDDWTTLSQKELDRHRTIAADGLLCQLVDATIVCSQKLYELKRPLVRQEPEVREKLFLIPNGVDADHYARVLDDSQPLPAAIAGMARPVFGYTGTIHPDRVDVDLLVRLAAEAPAGSFVLIGPSHLLPRHRTALAATGRVHLLPAVPYQQIPDYMRAFDVSITPHRMTPFTESLNPIKLWEYLAAGRPIVSTDVAGFRDYPAHVRIARNAEDFAAALHSALTESRSPEARAMAAARQAEARRHSWASRADQVEAVIENCLTKNPETLIHA